MNSNPMIPRRSTQGIVSCALLLSCSVLTAVTSAQEPPAVFRLSSATVQAGAKLGSEQVFNGMGCQGKNISPQLRWTGAPKDTKSFALTVYDPDAPTGSGWWHWVVYNLPASTTELVADAGGKNTALLPAGAQQGRTDFGTRGFGGACPPTGDKAHRYIFTIYALKTDKLDAPADSSAAMIGFMINANKLSSASLTALYGR